MTDDDVKRMLSNVDAVALTLWGEARGEPLDGIVAVAQVIGHRVRLGRWGGWRGVCHARLQFSCWWPEGGLDNYRKVMGLSRQFLAGSAPVTSVLSECRWVAEGVIAGRVRDTVAGATHYMTKALYQSAPPRWAQGRQPCVEIGAHVFFNDVP